MITNKPYEYVSEVNAMFMNKEDALNDRKLFVHNLGVLLAQTREHVISAELDDNEIVTITYNNGYIELVNVNLDSYTAIIRDVVKHI